MDPATEKPTFSVHEADVDDINLAVEYAKKAQPAWAALDSELSFLSQPSTLLIRFHPGSVRAEALNALAALVKENLDRFAELESISMGVPVSTFKYFGHYAAQSLSSYAAFGTSVLGESSLLSADRLDLVLKQPYGVTCGIIPWNAPLLMATACTVGPSVAAGNAIILKSSEKAPLTSILLAQLVKKCGLFPPGIIQIITGRGPTTGAALASHMEIRKLAFIGSVATGKKVKEMGARSNLKNVTCELGGKSPLLVFEDANIEKAANEAALSIGLLSGQTCVANSRLATPYCHS